MNKGTNHGRACFIIDVDGYPKYTPQATAAKLEEAKKKAVFIFRDKYGPLIADVVDRKPDASYDIEIPGSWQQVVLLD